MKHDRKEHFQILREETRGKRKVKVGRFYCILNGKTYDSLLGIRNAIIPTMTVKQYYDEHYKSEDEGTCNTCGKKHEVFKNLVDGYSEYCSSSCHNRSDKHRKIISERFNGDDEKRRLAIEKYRETVSQFSEDKKAEINKKTERTIRLRYGEDWRSNTTKAQWKRRTKEEIRQLTDKAFQTKKKNGNLEYNWFASANKKITLGGKTFFCQGYEDVVIRMLFDKGFKVEDILVGKDVPRIRYEGNKSKVYRPDILIKSLNLLIEVKSDFTYAGTEDMYKRNHDKQKASVEQGFLHVIFALSNVKNLSENRRALNEFIDMTISSQALHEEGKVQRLSHGWEYSPIAIGTGSARVPKGM